MCRRNKAHRDCSTRLNMTLSVIMDIFVLPFPPPPSPIGQRDVKMEARHYLIWYWHQGQMANELTTVGTSWDLTTLPQPYSPVT